METNTIIAILILSPVVGFLINGIRFRSPSAYISGTIGTLASAVSFICSVLLFFKLIDLPEGQKAIYASYYTWAEIGGARVSASFAFDQISALMSLVVTGVGTLIHMFSIGYMAHDDRPSKFFSYLNLFLFSMILLVLGSNILVMFMGWEGVGVCSYLLIGYWFKDVEKANAGMKAFITNRIGDVGLLLGMFSLFILFNSFEFREINELVKAHGDVSVGLMTMTTIFLFVGAIGKSAQLPLYVWLPDAMAGPTPVSALIHAATMVTAGVYMIVRLNPLFMATPTTMLIIGIVGALTLLFAATIGLTQWDIKKVLAYSTVSQLGYMFLACGVGAFGAAMFHLMTHAFFKALMFLGSGSVIHAMHEEQDMRKMGGLRKSMPITHLTFVMGWLAIIGTPFFSGFFSKDEILLMSWASPRGNFFFWLAGILGAGLTAFYMTRLMALTFWGESRVSSKVKPHESPLVMTIPLLALGLLSLIGGYVGVPHILGHDLGLSNVLEEWLATSVMTIPGMIMPSGFEEIILMLISVSVAGLSATVAYIFYVKEKEWPARVANKIKPAYALVNGKYFVDEIYQKYILDPIVKLSEAFWIYMDVGFIDKATYKASEFIKKSGEGLRSLQTGNLQEYAFYIVLGFVALISITFM